MKRLGLALAAALLAAAPLSASAQEVRIARQFSMGYLQFNVMEHEKLLEKHATALGLKDVKIAWSTFNGPNAMNDALISDSVDIVAGGVPGLLTLWNRTRGTANEVRGISALSSQPFLLNTRSDNIRSIADLKDSDRIAVPAVKVSVQAVALQMAAAKLHGQANYGKYDALTVSMSPARRHHRAALGLRRDQQCVQRAAVPAVTAREARRAHDPQLLSTSWTARTPSRWRGPQSASTTRIRCSTRR
jgi:NitT/TauT family transport system substrate-binding protein